MKQQKAFTLIELMVVIGIIGLLAGIAWPFYLDQVRTNKRTDAIVAANAVAMSLTQFESDNGVFAWDANPGASTVINAHNRFLPLVNVGTSSSNPGQNITCAQNRGFRWSSVDTRYESCRGYYSIVVDLTDPTGFKITVTPIANSDQAGDTDCASFILTNDGQKRIGAGSSSSSSVKRCWRSD